jgi:oligoendopeptidase F
MMSHGGRLWHRQLHLFEVPFYTSSTDRPGRGAAALAQARRDPAEALANIDALALGGSRPSPSSGPPPA